MEGKRSLLLTGIINSYYQKIGHYKVTVTKSRALQVDISAFTGQAHVAFCYTTRTGSGEGRRLGVDNPRVISTYGKNTDHLSVKQ
ncbi:hypothetical protein CBF23_008365 [Marinomonas agarivorans]|nr:hypothetical protein CBF23_008365 [Marinomonas agarivorans]